MKFKFTIFVIILGMFALSQFSLNALDKEKLPKLLGANNVGREFYFSFIPCWETAGATNDLKIYISSAYRTKVVVEVPQRGYEKIKYTIPNDIIEFSLTPAIGQPYQMTPWQPPEPEKIWRGTGVHVKADDPIICYGVTRYQYTSDGFLCIPVESLGKEYIISSFRDVAANSGQWLPSEFTVTAAYDKTKVLFTMGGNDWSKTVSGQLPEEMTSWNLNAGDVLMVSSLGQHADLSGSTIQASKPVAIVSGNYCAYVPTNCGCCDLLEEMELPTNSWGTEYHVTKIANRLKNSYIKVFAKEPKTNIYRDHIQLGFLRTAGGMESEGYLDMRADEGESRPIVISGDKPIGVTQFNTGQQDDGITSDPFQMVLTPIEQYQTEIIFNTPGINGGSGFSSNYINLCYETTMQDSIPDDLEFAKVEAGEFVWKKVKVLYPGAGDQFVRSNNKKYNSKTIRLPGDGVYKIRADKPFAAYSYGFSSYDSYGFPASVAVGDLFVKDTLPPDPDMEMDCKGNVNQDRARLVTDKPDILESRSNLATIYMHTDLSYNYRLFHADFMPCEDAMTTWRLETIDPMKDAKAVVSFIDCAGNDTTLEIEYISSDLDISEKIWNLNTVSINEAFWKQFFLKNNSTKPWTCTHLDLKYAYKGFSIWNEQKTGPLDLPFTISADDSISFWVKFISANEGTVWDSIGFGDSCFFSYQIYMKADVGYPILSVSDWTFPQTVVDSIQTGYFDLKNIGTVDLVITDHKGPFILKTDTDENIFTSNSLKSRNISEINPLIIKPNESIEFDINFNPDDSLSYNDSIIFISNSIKEIPFGTFIDSVLLISGTGIIPVGVDENITNKTKIYPNPVNDILIIEKLPINTNKILIFDESGKEVMTIDINNTSENLKITTKDLPQGNYILRIFVGSEIIDRKFVVLR